MGTKHSQYSTLCLESGYISLLDQEEQERVRLAFGSNYERLLDLSRNTIQMMCFDRRSTSRTHSLTRKTLTNHRRS